MQKYSFNNLIQLNFDFGKFNRYKKYFNNEYLRITESTTGGVTNNKSKSIINVYIVRKLPKKKPRDIKQIRSFKGLFTYKYLIRNLDSNTVDIYFEDHYISRLHINAVGVYLQAQVVEPIMYLKLIENNVLLMHAAGVVKGSKGYLLPAHGGTGKTTTSIALLSHGYKLLGDDLLLVDVNNGVVFPYPRPLHLFTYNIRSLRGAKIPFKYSLAIYSKNILRFFLERLLKTDFLISTRVHADEILPGDVFAQPVDYYAIKFLTKTGPAITTEKITPGNVNAIAQTIIESADLNISLYSLVGESQSKNVKKQEHDCLTSLLLQFEFITYLNTRKLDLDKAETISKIFDEV